MREFVEAHLNILVLFVLILLLLWGLMHLIRIGDTTDVNWAREQVSLVIGALLGLITGKSLGGSNGKNINVDKNVEEKQP